jgi:transcriptional regulator with XRE-family HTH domain
MPRLKQTDRQVQQRIADRIRQARTDKGLTQEQLAEALDVATETASRYESGKLPPSLPMLYRMAEALGVDIETLVRRGPAGPRSAEAELVEGWRSLESDEQRMVLHLVRRLSQGHRPKAQVGSKAIRERAARP